MIKGYFIVERDELEEYGSSDPPMTRAEAEKAMREYGDTNIVVIYGEIIPLVLGPGPEDEHAPQG